MRRVAMPTVLISTGGTMESNDPFEPLVIVESDKHFRAPCEPVMIVEDDKHIRQVLAETLRGMGLEVEAFATGELALARAVDQHFSVALVDLNLPGIKGIETLRRLRAFDARLPVIMMTAYHTHDTILAARTSGAVDFLCKPFLPVHVREAVERQLKHR